MKYNYDIEGVNNLRDRVLNILLKNRDNFISGQIISNSLNISRAAVWKHIKSLQEIGFVIESVSNRGYRLIGIPDIIDKFLIESKLQTNRFARNIKIFESVDSTNNQAKKLALDNAEEGTLVTAEQQRAGKGRLGREWVSDKYKGIWMSLILKPSLPPEEAPLFTAVAAAAVVKGIEKSTNLHVGIKWPNDIIVNRKKVCGVLTEISADPDRINYIIVGIGINVNHILDDFPQEIKETATSISIEKGYKIARYEIIAQVMNQFEQLYDLAVLKNDFNHILDICRENSVTLGSEVRVCSRNDEFIGIAKNLRNDGALIVIDAMGNERVVMSADVSVRGVNGYV